MVFGIIPHTHPCPHKKEDYQRFSKEIYDAGQDHERYMVGLQNIELEEVLGKGCQQEKKAEERHKITRDHEKPHRLAS